MRPPPVLVMLAIAIACCVAAEAGLSDWMLRFLEDLPVELASVALTLFWAGIAVGRLGFARVGERLDPVGLPVAMLATAGLVLGCGVALVAVRRMAAR